MESFDDVTWKTAQTTGAFSYMPYDDARTYSDIYDTQDELFKVQQQVVEDVMGAASLFISKSEDDKPTTAEIDATTERIGMIQMRLILLEDLVNNLDKTYQKFKSQHP